MYSFSHLFWHRFLCFPVPGAMGRLVSALRSLSGVAVWTNPQLQAVIAGGRSVPGQNPSRIGWMGMIWLLVNPKISKQKSDSDGDFQGPKEPQNCMSWRDYATMSGTEHGLKWKGQLRIFKKQTYHENNHWQYEPILQQWKCQQQWIFNVSTTKLQHESKETSKS